VGRRERKKEQTAQRISAQALRLFAKQGFRNVTMTEIAESADVSRGTLFSYFPTKESLVLAAVGDDDPARVAAARPSGMPVVAALRDHYRKFAADPGVDHASDLLSILRIISETPSLSAGVNRLYDAQRDALADLLRSETGAPKDGLMCEVVAAQICATILAIKSIFFHRLASGRKIARVVSQLPADVESAFDLLEHGIGSRYSNQHPRTKHKP
jgi:AcrR family transcriptional regulator